MKRSHNEDVEDERDDNAFSEVFAGRSEESLMEEILFCSRLEKFKDQYSTEYIDDIKSKLEEKRKEKKKKDNDDEEEEEEKEEEKGDEEKDLSSQHFNMESQELHQIPFQAIAQHSHSHTEKDKEADLLSINLKRNRLSVVVIELYSFTSLHTLDLSRNKIHTISPGISQLVHLERLILLSNKLKISTIPLDELVAMSSLGHIDFRYNEKIEKQEACKTIRGLLGKRVLIGDQDKQKEVAAVMDSACDRDGDVLRDQLAPWSTPQLRHRLRDVFGVATDPETLGRDGVMDLLLKAYAQHGPRTIVQACGKPVDPTLITELTACLQTLAWPTTTRERPKVQAYRYFTLQRPDTKFTVETGAKAKINAMKLEKYADIWNLLNKTLESVYPDFARIYTGVAVTYGFIDSPHIDTENIGPFCAISLGNFEGGGCIAVESSPLEVTHLTTYHRMAMVDGRFPHWVTKYRGERYSLIYYRTVGEVTPITKAVLS